MSIQCWTDYPFRMLGDEPNKEAPIRPCEVINYDGDKYVTVLVGGGLAEIKAGYCYKRPGRCGEVPQISRFKLNRRSSWKTLT